MSVTTIAEKKRIVFSPTMKCRKMPPKFTCSFSLLLSLSPFDSFHFFSASFVLFRFFHFCWVVALKITHVHFYSTHIFVCRHCSVMWRIKNESEKEKKFLLLLQKKKTDRKINARHSRMKHDLRDISKEIQLNPLNEQEVN